MLRVLALAALAMLVAPDGARAVECDAAAAWRVARPAGRGVTSLTAGDRASLHAALFGAFPGARVAWARETGRPVVLVVPSAGSVVDEALRDRAAPTAAGEEQAGPVDPRVRRVLTAFRAQLPAGVEMVAGSGAAERGRFAFRATGLEIFPAAVTVTPGVDQVLMVGSIPASGRIEGERTRDTAECVGIARRAVALEESRGAIRTRDVLFDTGSGLRHAIVVELPSKRPLGDFEVVVDAAHGTVLSLENLACGIDGTATVYRTSPLDGPIVEEPIRHIENSGRLEGLHVTVENEDTPTRASATNNHFRYPESNKHLDEVNVYYHLDRIVDWFEEVHGFEYPEAPIAAGVYYGENYDNAMFLPWGNCIVFGDGYRYNVLSRDASVAYHEMTHAMTNAIQPLGPGGEAGAMNEGFSDYFAATLTNDPAVGRWIVAKANRPFLRNCKNSLHYPQDLKNDSHDDAPLWAGPLWDLREQLGAGIVDRLAHRCRFALSREATFQAGLEALLATDRELFEGKNSVTIRETFSRRGIEPAAALR